MSTQPFHVTDENFEETIEKNPLWINNMTKNETDLVVLECKEKSYQVLSVVQWDEAFRMKSREDYAYNPTPNWLKIPEKSVPEALYEVVCP